MSELSRRSVLGAGVALTAAPAVAEGASAPVTSALAPEGIIPLFLSGDRVLIIVRSRGRGPFPMVFDTGSSENAIDTELERQLQLRRIARHDVNDGATGTSIAAHISLMPAIQVDDYVVGDRPVSVYDYKRPSELGIFGPALFPGRLVQVELANARVRIREKNAFSAPAEGRLTYLGAPGDSVPSMDIQLPGLGQVRAVMDTGNNGELILPADCVDKVPLQSAPTLVGRETSVSGSRDVFGARMLGDVRIGSVTLTNPFVTFAAAAADGANVGLPVLRRLTFLLDPQGEACWLLERQTPSVDVLSSFTGQFGARSIRLDGDSLIYERPGQPTRRMHYMGCDLFVVEGTGDQFEFRRQNGVITGVTFVTSSNQVVENVKTA